MSIGLSRCCIQQGVIKRQKLNVRWEVQKQLWFKEEYKDLASVQEERDENSTKSEIATTTRPYAQRGGGWD